MFYGLNGDGLDSPGELQKKFALPAVTTADFHRAKDFLKKPDPLITKIFAATATLPVAIFFSVAGDTDAARWALASHGGFEPSGSVKDFLAAEMTNGKTAAYAAFGAANGPNAFARKKWNTEVFTTAYTPKNALPIDGPDNQGPDTVGEYKWEDHKYRTLLYQWADVADEDTGDNTQYYDGDACHAQGGRCVLGRILILQWMRDNNVITLFRGHQHSGASLRGVNAYVSLFSLHFESFFSRRAQRGVTCQRALALSTSFRSPPLAPLPPLLLLCSGHGVYDRFPDEGIVTTTISLGAAYDPRKIFNGPTTPGFALLDLAGAKHASWTLSRCFFSTRTSTAKVEPVKNWQAGKALNSVNIESLVDMELERRKNKLDRQNMDVERERKEKEDARLQDMLNAENKEKERMVDASIQARWMGVDTNHLPYFDHRSANIWSWIPKQVLAAATVTKGDHKPLLKTSFVNGNKVRDIILFAMDETKIQYSQLNRPGHEKKVTSRDVLLLWFSNSTKKRTQAQIGGEIIKRSTSNVASSVSECSEFGNSKVLHADVKARVRARVMRARVAMRRPRASSRLTRVRTPAHSPPSRSATAAAISPSTGSSQRIPTRGQRWRGRTKRTTRACAFRWAKTSTRRSGRRARVIETQRSCACSSTKRKTRNSSPH